MGLHCAKRCEDDGAQSCRRLHARVCAAVRSSGRLLRQEQQERLHVDEHGIPRTQAALAAAIASAPPPLQVQAPVVEARDLEEAGASAEELPFVPPRA